MDTAQTAVSAAVGAIVAVGVTLVAAQIQKHKDNEAVQAEMNRAWDLGRTQGYFEGRESVVQHFGATATPESFAK